MQENQEHRDFIDFDGLDDFELVEDEVSEVLVLEFVSEELPDGHVVKLVDVFFEDVGVMCFAWVADNFIMGLENVFGDVFDFGEEFGDGLFVLGAEVNIHSGKDCFY